MAKAYVFPGQGAQFEGMGKDLYESHAEAKKIFDSANEILGYDLTKIMFEGSAEDLKQTKVTQPSLFVHSIATLAKQDTDFVPAAVAGHSLGEFSALTENGVLSFEDGLRLVYARAMAMQEACEAVPGTMAAILGLDNETVEEICATIENVVPANYNCPGQLVISGSNEAIEAAMAACKEAGAKRALPLPVGGAFHSPLMQPAKEKLEAAINNTTFNTPKCPIFQNVNAEKITDPTTIKENLIAQLTGPVKWTQIMQNMVADGITEVVEVGGNGKVISGLFRKLDRQFPTQAL